ncbi:MAG: MBL fold metallo-hydrolase [Candidatus Sumerlaeota bacterium]|nr:MBL fold metallo-hydrolase [Candidatus Sumerlaeota bacterium]
MPMDNAMLARFYFVDVGTGNADLVVSPSGETMLLDAGPGRAAERILACMAEQGVAKIDYFLISHFEEDHMGAAHLIAEKVPVLNYVDHGESIVYGKDDEWWKERRRQAFREGMGKEYDRRYDIFRAARDKANHIVGKPGDRVPIAGLDVVVACAGGRTIRTPLDGAGAPNPHGSGIEPRAEDDAEDGQSVGVVVNYGQFRFVYLADLTWNAANALFYPRNLIGEVDAYIVTHHAYSFPRDFGEYFYGLSACSPAELHGLSSRAAILSLGGQGHKHGTAEGMKVLHSVPGMDLWQTEFIREGGESGYNGPEPYIANIEGKNERVPHIALAAKADGSFTMTNSRNGFEKRYPPR